MNFSPPPVEGPGSNSTKAQAAHQQPERRQTGRIKQSEDTERQADKAAADGDVRQQLISRRPQPIV